MEDPKRLEEGWGHTALVPNTDDKNIHLSEKVGKADGGDDTHNEKVERSAAHDHLLAEHGGDRQPVVNQIVATLDAFKGLTTAASARDFQFIYSENRILWSDMDVLLFACSWWSWSMTLEKHNPASIIHRRSSFHWWWDQLPCDCIPNSEKLFAWNLKMMI